VKRWRPKNWSNPFISERDYFNKKYGHQEGDSVSNRDIADFEAGADALWDALWKLAEESPTKTFTIDSNEVSVYENKKA